MRKLAPRRARRDERGAGAVEFALLVLPLLWIVFAIVNFGVVLSQQLSLDNAARDAARYAVVDMESRVCGDIEGHAEAVTWTSGETVTVTDANDAPPPGPCESPCEGSDPDTDIKVTLDYTSNLPMPIFPFPDTMDLTGEGVFRCEYT